MHLELNHRPSRFPAASVPLAFLAALIALFPLRSAKSPAAGSGDPWTSAQIIQPADLAKELASSSAANKPIVVCVGMRTLFKSAHVPGAVFRGPAMSPSGLEDLKKWAQPIPRSANLVVYCGCCPLASCPNLRPGFIALRDMGFHHLRVLPVPNSFASDWVEKGILIEKGE